MTSSTRQHVGAGPPSLYALRHGPSRAAKLPDQRTLWRCISFILTARPLVQPIQAGSGIDDAPFENDEQTKDHVSKHAGACAM